MEAILQDYHQAIKDALLDLKSSTESKLAKKILELESPMVDILKEDCILLTNIDAICSRLLYLDRKDLEKQEVEGQSEMHHIQRGAWPTPNFSFNLSVRFPIRQHDERTSNGSKWKTLICRPGGYTFTGVLINPRFADVYAKVTLGGWRKEIFASEIEELKSSLNKTNAERAELEKRKVQVEATLSKNLYQAKLNFRLDHFIKDLDYLNDLERISAKRPSFPKEVLPFLDAGSISGLAQYYGLVSSVNKNEGGMSELSTGAKWLIETYKVQLDSVLESIKGSKANYRDFSSKSTSASHKFLASFEDTKVYSSKNSQQAQDPSIVEFKAICSIVFNKKHTMVQESDPILEALYKSARSDLANLRAWESSQDGVVSRFKAEAAELEQEFEKRRNARAHKDVRDFKENIKLTEMDEMAWQLAAKAMQNEFRHIGVFAALRHAPTMGDAWMSILRGMRFYMVEKPEKIIAIKGKKKNRKRRKRN